MPHSRRALLLSCITLAGCAVGNPYRRAAISLSKPLASAGIEKIAVVPLENLCGVETPVGAAAAEELMTSLHRRPGLALVERAALARILEEQKLALTGAVDPSTAKVIGRLVGADGIVAGSVSCEKSGWIVLNARVISVESGRVISAFRGSAPLDWERRSGQPREQDEIRMVHSHSTRKDFLKGTWSGWGTDILGTEDASVVLDFPCRRVSRILDDRSLPEARIGGAAVSSAGRLYVLGGKDNEKVLSADIREDGTLGPWRRESPLPEWREGLAAAVWNERLFVSGGAHRTPSATVWSAPILEEGRLGDWTEAAPLPDAFTGHAMIAWAGSLLVVGASHSQPNIRRLLSAPIEPLGRLGAWRIVDLARAPEPGDSPYSLEIGGTALAGLIAEDRLRAEAWAHLRMFGMAVCNGTVFVIGGNVAQNPLTVSLDIFGTRMSDLERWREEVRFPGSRTEFGAMVPAWGGSLYVVGGRVGFSQPATSVMRVDVEAAKKFVEAGDYSNGFELGRPAGSCRFRWSGSFAKEDIQVFVRTAEAGRRFGPWRAISDGSHLDPGTRHIEYTARLRRRSNGDSPRLEEVLVECGQL